MYLVVDGVKRTLICSKSRLAPASKSLAIPRLELMGALIGARLGDAVKLGLNMCGTEIPYFTDSMIVLHCIRSDPIRWGVFVRNRVVEIQSLRGNWNWTPGDSNPSDIPTRGCCVRELSQLW